MQGCSGVLGTNKTLGSICSTQQNLSIRLVSAGARSASLGMAQETGVHEACCTKLTFHTLSRSTIPSFARPLLCRASADAHLAKVRHVPDRIMLAVVITCALNGLQAAAHNLCQLIITLQEHPLAVPQPCRLRQHALHHRQNPIICISRF